MSLYLLLAALKCVDYYNLFVSNYYVSYEEILHTITTVSFYTFITTCLYISLQLWVIVVGKHINELFCLQLHCMLLKKTFIKFLYSVYK